MENKVVPGCQSRTAFFDMFPSMSLSDTWRKMTARSLMCSWSEIDKTMRRGTLISLLRWLAHVRCTKDICFLTCLICRLKKRNVLNLQFNADLPERAPLLRRRRMIVKMTSSDEPFVFYQARAKRAPKHTNGWLHPAQHPRPGARCSSASACIAVASHSCHNLILLQ